MPKDTRVPSLSRSYRVEPYPSAHPEPVEMPATITTTVSASLSTPEHISPTQERPSTAWSSEDDERLMRYRAQGLNWGPIANNFSGKTANACRKRHERLMEKKNAESWDGVRTEDLATAYLECREEMWKLVAARLGSEKWTTIERKCMEKGLKTLQSSARSARRSSVKNPIVSSPSLLSPTSASGSAPSCPSPPLFPDNTENADVPLSARFPSLPFPQHTHQHSPGPLGPFEFVSRSSRSSSLSYANQTTTSNPFSLSSHAYVSPTTNTFAPTLLATPPTTVGRDSFALQPLPSMGQTLPSISCAIDLPRLHSILGPDPRY